MNLNSGIQTYQILTNNDDVCISSLSSILLAVQISGSWPSRDITIIGWKQFLNDHSYFYGPAAISLYEIYLKILTLCVNVLSIHRGNTRWRIEIRIHSQNGFNPLCIVSSVWRRWLAIVLFFFLLFWAKERQEIVFEFDVNC